MELDAMIFIFRVLSQLFHSPLSLSSRGSLFFTFCHKGGVICISEVLIFLLAILISACDSSGPSFHMMYSAYKLNKQSDNIQPWCTTLLIWNQSVVACPILIFCINISIIPLNKDFPEAQIRSCLQYRRPSFDPWVRKILWRREWQSTPVFLLGGSHRQRSLEGYSSWGHKESNTNEQLSVQTHTYGSSNWIYSLR